MLRDSNKLLFLLWILFPIEYMERIRIQKNNCYLVFIQFYHFHNTLVLTINFKTLFNLEFTKKMWDFYKVQSFRSHHSIFILILSFADLIDVSLAKLALRDQLEFEINFKNLNPTIILTNHYMIIIK
jgi:hypothetical protein